jgi:hypothetical protein
VKIFLSFRLERSSLSYIESFRIYAEKGGKECFLLPGSAVVAFFAGSLSLVMQLWVNSLSLSLYVMLVCENVEWNKRFYYSNFNSSLSFLHFHFVSVPLGSEIFMALFGTIFRYGKHEAACEQ